MTDVMLARARIEPGKADKLRRWYEELQNREAEVVDTLQYEGVYTESAFIHSIEGQTYLYGYLEAPDMQAADDAGDEEAHEITEQHHDVFDEALRGDWEELECIGDFTNPDRE
ncbi:MAG: DUF6176 family protein [Halobacteriaceae archaeon]